MSAVRDARGHFVQGNPGGGRPAGTVGLAERVKAATNDGADLVEYLVTVVTSTGETTRDRIQAASTLLDRGWGRAVQAIELNNMAQATAADPAAAPLGADPVEWETFLEVYARELAAKRARVALAAPAPHTPALLLAGKP